MKLSDWARRQGISYITAWRWFKAGKLPVPARQLPTGACGRLYGRRSARNRAKRALEAMRCG